MFLLLLLFAAWCPIALAQAPPENRESQPDPYIQKYNERRAKNPEGLSFTVRFKENKKQFHLGEIISLELSFASSKPDIFTLDAATYDRSGRLHSDGFALDPLDGVVDPIADYFNSSKNYFMGGLRAIPDLTEKPYLITKELNEWHRIDKPGHYRMYVVSNRVGRKSASLDSGGPAVVSNVIEFDILPPDKQWSKQKLNEAISALSKTDRDHEAACRTLRFLGTTAAATEMRKRFRGDDNQCEWEYKFGLIGSPHREFVIRDMENSISLREQSVTSHFISTLALLEFAKRALEEPVFPEDGDEEQIRQWGIQIAKYRSIEAELRLQYVRQLVLAVSQKEGQARATSLQTLLDYRAELSASGFTQWSNLVAFMPEVFNRLPRRDQLFILERQWKPIASAAMLPVLRDIFKKTNPTENNVKWDAFEASDKEKLRTVALRRIYELSPDEGRRLIVEEISRPEPRVKVEVLRSLPDETLPELNNVLLNNLKQASKKGNWTSVAMSELIERYASDEIVAQVRAVYESQGVYDWDCGATSALLAYFLRTSPALGTENLKKVLDARGKYDGCYQHVLSNIAELRMSPEIEEFATATLEDANADVVSQAAEVLAQYGSADAEETLWRRFEKWHEAAQSEKELSDAQEKIEESLRQALAGGKAWFFDPEKLKRVRDLCLTDKCRKELDEKIDNWGYHIYINFDSFDEEPSVINVAQYQLKSLALLKEKLLQFPKGSVFKIRAHGNRPDGSSPEEVLLELGSYLEKNGMKLIRETQE